MKYLKAEIIAVVMMAVMGAEMWVRIQAEYDLYQARKATA